MPRSDNYIESRWYRVQRVSYLSDLTVLCLPKPYHLYPSHRMIQQLGWGIINKTRPRFWTKNSYTPYYINSQSIRSKFESSTAPSCNDNHVIIDMSSSPNVLSRQLHCISQTHLSTQTGMHSGILFYVLCRLHNHGDALGSVFCRPSVCPSDRHILMCCQYKWSWEYSCMEV